jgi:hypothetical protein
MLTAYNRYVVTTAQEKGNALEAAVLAIEELILRTSPAVKEKTYVIESKKIINAGGVRHEIDLFVTFELGPGYNPVFIFECKNWQEAVGKNEIIVFCRKNNGSWCAGRFLRGEVLHFGCHFSSTERTTHEIGSRGGA